MCKAIATAASLPETIARPESRSNSVTFCPWSRNIRDESGGIFRAQHSGGREIIWSSERWPASISLKTMYITTSFVIEAGGTFVSAAFSKRMEPVSVSIRIAFSAEIERFAGITG